MRTALFCALVLASTAVAANPRRAVGLTIVLDFQGPRSERSVDEMKRELEGLMKDSGLVFNWRLRSEAQQESFPNLVVVRFKGKCVMEPVGYLYDERGPFAFTYSTDGVVQPFSEVACDQVTASLRSAMFGGDFAHADTLLGRALGRVVAHELVHILAKSGTHGHTGVAKAALSAQQLISDRLALDASDIERVRNSQ
jgi:hypothetical protein